MELKNVNSSSAEIWAKCHGSEDYYRMEFPYRVENGDPMADATVNDHVQMAIKAFCPFDPQKLL